jgi:hypothetical protein
VTLRLYQPRNGVTHSRQRTKYVCATKDVLQKISSPHAFAKYNVGPSASHELNRNLRQQVLHIPLLHAHIATVYCVVVVCQLVLNLCAHLHRPVHFPPLVRTMRPVVLERGEEFLPSLTRYCNSSSSNSSVPLRSAKNFHGPWARKSSVSSLSMDAGGSQDAASKSHVQFSAFVFLIVPPQVATVSIFDLE